MAKDHEEDEDIEDVDIEDTDEDTDEGDDEGDEDKDTDPDLLKDEDIEKDNDVKSLKAKLKKQQDARIAALTAKRQLTARARAAEAKKKNSSASPDIKKTNQERKTGSDHLEKRLSAIEVIEQKRQFGHENGLSPEETDLAFKFANGKPSKRTLSDPFFKAGLEGIRAAKKTAANIPGSSKRSPSFSSKPFSELSKEDRRKQHEDRMNSIRRG